MRPALIAFAGLGIASAASAQGDMVHVGWAGPLVADAQVVVAVRDELGNVLIAQRATAALDALEIRLPLPSIPRRAASVQAALLGADGIEAQSAVAPISTRDALPPLSLTATLALGFQTKWHCDTGEVLTISNTLPMSVTSNNGAALTWTRDDADDSNVLVRDDHLIRRLDGDDSICLPLPHPPVLPVTIAAQDDSWSATLTHDTALLALPDLDVAAVTTEGVRAHRDSSGALVFLSGGATIRLSNAPCRLSADGLTYPFSATADLAGGQRLTAACAGDPLAAISSQEWRITSLLGIENHLNLSLRIQGNDLSGRTPCNRYLARINIEDDTLSIQDIGTTRLACADMALGNIEQRFLEALESVTYFSLGKTGGLVLKSGPIPLMTATLNTP